MSAQHTPGKVLPVHPDVHDSCIKRVFTDEQRRRSTEFLAICSSTTAPNEGNAMRFAACWNALIGISTEQIEAGAVAKLVAAAKSLSGMERYADSYDKLDDNERWNELNEALVPFKDLNNASAD